MKNNNKGYTLMEILIVLAIMGVVIGFFVSDIGYISGGSVRGCVKSIKVALSEVRIKTMGKTETLFCLYKGSDGYYIVHGVDGTTEPAERCGSGTVTIRYYTASNPTVAQTVDTGAPLVIGFNRANGSIDTSIGASINIDGSYVTVSGTDCNKIEVTGGGKSETIMISTATGKVYSD